MVDKVECNATHALPHARMEVRSWTRSVRDEDEEGSLTSSRPRKRRATLQGDLGCSHGFGHADVSARAVLSRDTKSDLAMSPIRILHAFPRQRQERIQRTFLNTINCSPWHCYLARHPISLPFPNLKTTHAIPRPEAKGATSLASQTGLFGATFVLVHESWYGQLVVPETAYQ